jgi:hypothetical protein
MHPTTTNATDRQFPQTTTHHAHQLARQGRGRPPPRGRHRLLRRQAQGKSHSLFPRLISSSTNTHQVNCNEIARLFGPDATYNSIEGFLRGPKALAKRLIDEAADRPTATPARARGGSKTPKSSPAKGSPAKGKMTFPAVSV